MPINKDSGEPFSGVAALFNADLNTKNPSYAPRNHWDVISKSEIRHLPIEEILESLVPIDKIKEDQ